MKRRRSGAGRSRQQPWIGAPDPALTPNAGLAAVTELCGRLGVIGALDAAVGPIKQRERGFGAGELLAGLAAAQLAGEDFLTGLDRQCVDAAGQQITPVPGLASTTAAGLARRVTPGQWKAVEAGLAAATGRMLALLPAQRAAALTGGPVTIDLDTTDVEVYGRKKRGVAYNHQGQRVGRPHVATWAETEIGLAADLGDGTDDPRSTAPAVRAYGDPRLAHMRMSSTWMSAASASACRLPGSEVRMSSPSPAIRLQPQQWPGTRSSPIVASELPSPARRAAAMGGTKLPLKG